MCLVESCVWWSYTASKFSKKNKMLKPMLNYRLLSKYNKVKNPCSLFPNYNDEQL